MRLNLLCSTVLVSVLSVPCVSFGVTLFSDDFDADHSANWTTNNSANIDSPLSQPADYFFDYNTVGIPSAPHSAGGSTRGMKLQANMDLDGISGSGVTGVTGMSVSPNGVSIPASGDFKITADLWGNYMTNTAAGTTNFPTIGYGTSGTFQNYPGNVDAVFFGTSLDGDTASDVRAYGPERSISYQAPYLNALTDIDSMGKPIDSHATYLAGTRNNITPPVAPATVGSGIADFDNSGFYGDAADYTIWRDNQGATGPLTPAGTAVVKTVGNADGNLVVDDADYINWKAYFGTNIDLYKTALPNAPAPPAAQIALFPQQDPAFNPANGNPPTTALNPNTAATVSFAWHQYEIDKVGNLYTWKIDGTTLITVDLTNSGTALGGTDIMLGISDINAGAPADVNRAALLFALFDNIKVETIPPGSGSGGLGNGTVPEPSTLVMVLCGIGAFVCKRRFAERAA